MNGITNLRLDRNRKSVATLKSFLTREVLVGRKTWGLRVVSLMGRFRGLNEVAAAGTLRDLGCAALVAKSSIRK
jgi:hypothetical protein